MSEVFLSYKRKYDSAQANCVRGKLASLGVKVFIDHDDIGSSDFIDAIHRELVQARAVLVLWTETSITSSYVKGEALHGLNRNILVAAMFDKLAPESLPSPFNTFNALDLSNWMQAGASAKDPQWQQLLRSLGEKLGRPGLSALSLAIENGSNDAKRAFLAAFPNDPMSGPMFDALEATYRDQFTQAMGKAEGAIDRRADYARRKLKDVGKEFDAWAKEWRGGSTRLPPDPRTAFTERTRDIQGDIEEYKKRLEKQKAQLDLLQEKLKDESTDPGFVRSRTTGALAIAALLIGFVIGPIAFELFDATKHLIAPLARLGIVDASNNELLRLRRNNGQLQAETRDLTALVAQLRSDKQGLATDLERANLRARNLADDLQQLEKSRQALTDQIAQLERDKRALVDARAGLERQVSDLKDQQRQWAARAADIESRERQVKTDSDQTKALRGDIDREAAKLREDRTKLANDQEALRQRELALAEKATDLANRLAALRKSEADIAARSEQLDKLNDQLKIAETAINTARTQLTLDQQALKAEKDRLAEEQTQLKAQRAEIDKRDADAKTKQDAAAKQKEALIARCDDLTAYQYDLDRPSGSKWVVNHTEINPAGGAMEACAGALKLARDDRQVERRIALGLGRVYAARATQLAKKGDDDNADEAFNKAKSYWTQAANLGSGHAHNVLGTYYQGQFAVEREPQSKYEPPGTKDLKLAWKYFEQAADLGNPLGLTTTAYYLLYPEWFENITEADYSRGRAYLEKARQLPRPYDSPYIAFVLGVAMLYGHGYPQNEDAGLRFISDAYCRGDRTAAKFFADSRGRYRPITCPRGAVSSG